MGFRIAQVDAFTDKAFAGNPAGVCILTERVSDSWMQNMAKEMNLAETAFLLKESGGYNLRWFTPTIEVELCGHATLAAAHTLWELGYLPENESAHFSSLSGPLHAHRSGAWIELDFPAERESESTCPDALAKGLGTQFTYVGKNRFDYLVVVESEQLVRGLTPNMAMLRQVPERGVIVTAASDSDEFDFVSRFFAPSVGIDEDPVTGSAHCCLAPYWANLLGKSELVAYQASERGGIVRMRLENDRVILAGKAVTIFTGETSPGAHGAKSIDIKAESKTPSHA